MKQLRKAKFLLILFQIAVIPLDAVLLIGDSVFRHATVTLLVLTLIFFGDLVAYVSGWFSARLGIALTSAAVVLTFPAMLGCGSSGMWLTASAFCFIKLGPVLTLFARLRKPQNA